MNLRIFLLVSESDVFRVSVGTAYLLDKKTTLPSQTRTGVVSESNPPPPPSEVGWRSKMASMSSVDLGDEGVNPVPFRTCELLHPLSIVIGFPSERYEVSTTARSVGKRCSIKYGEPMDAIPSPRSP